MNDPATTEIYTLSLHDALPISRNQTVRRQEQREGSRKDSHKIILSLVGRERNPARRKRCRAVRSASPRSEEHTSDSSHVEISYAVFCLKKKNTIYSSLPTHM